MLVAGTSRRIGVEYVGQDRLRLRDCQLLTGTAKSSNCLKVCLQQDLLVRFPHGNVSHGVFANRIEADKAFID
jgi:hypothetical protein